MENRQQNTVFILVGGLILSIFTIAISYMILYLGVENPIIANGLLYIIEFGFFCLALFLYKQWVTSILWFSQAGFVLILVVLFKIVVSVILLYIILSLGGFFLNNSAWNFLALFGPYVRGFPFELVGIGIAAKLFETDIFRKEANNKTGNIIDDL